MADVHLAIGSVAQRGAPIMVSSDLVSQMQTGVTNGAAVLSTIICDRTFGVVRIFPTVGSVYVKVGQNPVADAVDSILCGEGIPEYFSIQQGERISVIEA